MKKTNEKEIEQKLLSQSSLDELIKIKMEEELKKEIEKAKEKPSKKIITDVSKVPAGFIFSKHATYRMFNRTNKCETFLNGIQAEALLGLQTNVREKIKNGQTDAFSTETAYVKFEYVEL